MKAKGIVALLLTAAAALPLVAGVGAISAACSGSLLLVALLILAFVYSPLRRAALIGLFVATPVSLTLAAIFVLIEQGETVVLRTFDQDGGGEETRLWVVDFEGRPWLGAGGGETRRWYQRLLAVPRVEVVRQGLTSCFRADPVLDPAVRDAVVELTRRKYRLGNLGLSIGNGLGIPMRVESVAIPVRLLPCDSAPQ